MPHDQLNHLVVQLHAQVERGGELLRPEEGRFAGGCKRLLTTSRQPVCADVCFLSGFVIHVQTIREDQETLSGLMDALTWYAEGEAEDRDRM